MTAFRFAACGSCEPVIRTLFAGCSHAAGSNQETPGKKPGVVIKIETAHAVGQLTRILLVAMRYPRSGIMMAAAIWRWSTGGSGLRASSR